MNLATWKLDEKRRIYLAWRYFEIYCYVNLVASLSQDYFPREGNLKLQNKKQKPKRTRHKKISSTCQNKHV